MFHYILIFPYVSFLALNPKNWRKTFNKAQKFSAKITLHNLRHALVLRKYSPIWIFWRKWTYRPKQKLYQEKLTIGILSFCKISIFILSWPTKVNRTWTLTRQKLLLSHQLRLFKFFNKIWQIADCSIILKFWKVFSGLNTFLERLF